MANKEQIKERQRKYYEANREKILEKAKYRDKNIKNQKEKEYYLKNKESILLKSRERYNKNKEDIKNKQKERRENNKDFYLEKGRFYYYKNKKTLTCKQYNITEEEYSILMEKRDKFCEICKNECVNICIDHCHNSGIVRGLLCGQCNLGLGCFKDNNQYIDNAINYLYKYIENPRRRYYIPKGFRICRLCDEIKRKWEFSRGFHTCKECVSDKIQYKIDKSILSRYNLTQQEYLDLISECNNKCSICSLHYNDLCVDHNHEDGSIRGMLCRCCNTALGAFEDNIKHLRSSIAYLEKFNAS